MSEKEPPERIADLLASWAVGHRKAGDRLFTLLYAELRRVARAGLRGRSPDSLDTAALIHDAYIKLTAGSPVQVENQAHFLSLASRTMRQIIIDHARRKAATKRGGELLRVSTLGAVASEGMSADDLLALGEALAKLEEVEPLLAKMVDMRYFGGLTMEETAEALAISTATAKRHWIRARAFLYQQLRQTPAADHGHVDPSS
jgi:RNA polymerase sigma-70 factor (ECF subfamily)